MLCNGHKQDIDDGKSLMDRHNYVNLSYKENCFGHMCTSEKWMLKQLSIIISSLSICRNDIDLSWYC